MEGHLEFTSPNLLASCRGDLRCHAPPSRSSRLALARHPESDSHQV